MGDPLVHTGDMSPQNWKRRQISTRAPLYEHLNRFVDAGLVEKRQRTERTVFGAVTLTGGVDELTRSEQEFERIYDSSAERRSPSIRVVGPTAVTDGRVRDGSRAVRHATVLTTGN
ncbi:Bacterial regulatory protein, arsR family [Halogeometricum pallidum JCM 14848]|uniref:Bacterial regulatory protein, arsR family n=1 Tax=Halogeometricum pallidum JCM 14848 TaxID=1227487 RepID=M0DB39_HALPD|nr:Bacterial regulatory protein, arsR family [Halogeometricum pallidum JCM 14848]